jgi:hypothetical protein
VSTPPARRSWLRTAGALAGIAGPVAFTTSWLVGGIRQSGYPIADEHISGLAARDADHPGPMIAGFLAAGAGTLAFAATLHRELSAPTRRAGAGPLLLGLAGAAEFTAGLLRRDTVLLNPPGRAEDWRQSRHNDGHDASAGVAFVCAVSVPMALAVRFRGDPAWSPLVPSALVAAAVSGALMGAFATDVDRHGNGLLQRAMVTLPQVFQVALAAHLLAHP